LKQIGDASTLNESRLEQVKISNEIPGSPATESELIQRPSLMRNAESKIARLQSVAELSVNESILPLISRLVFNKKAKHDLTAQQERPR
jgi:hypothetical protein